MKGGMGGDEGGVIPLKGEVETLDPLGFPPKKDFSRQLDLADQLAELVDIFEAPIDGGEAHVGDFVDAL